METLKFNTNIKCAHCVNTVKPALDAHPGIENWEVDLNSPERKLTLRAQNLQIDDLQKTLAGLGYTIEPQAE